MAGQDRAVKLLLVVYIGCVAVTVALIVWLVLAFTTGKSQ